MDVQLKRGILDVCVLAAIKDEESYGYKIIKELERRSENVFSLKEGTLYPILHALEENGMVEAYWVDADSRKRKYYHITRKGKACLKEKKEEFKVYSAAVGKVLGIATV